MIDFSTYTKTIDENGKVVRLYKCWQDMKSRCYNKNNKNYHQYGGNGITVCNEWLDNYQTFRIWATENGYSDELTLDRIDFESDYTPNNCRWVSIKKQQNNRSNNRYIEFNGEVKTLSEWCEDLGLNKSTISSRINREGTEPLIALGLSEKYKTKKNNKYFIWNGVEKTYKEWCNITGEKLYNVHNRINNLNWSIEKALGLTKRLKKFKSI